MVAGRGHGPQATGFFEVDTVPLMDSQIHRIRRAKKSDSIGLIIDSTSDRRVEPSIETMPLMSRQNEQVSRMMLQMMKNTVCRIVINNGRLGDSDSKLSHVVPSRIGRQQTPAT